MKPMAMPSFPQPTPYPNYDIKPPQMPSFGMKPPQMPSFDMKPPNFGPYGPASKP